MGNYCLSPEAVAREDVKTLPCPHHDHDTSPLANKNHLRQNGDGHSKRMAAVLSGDARAVGGIEEETTNKEQASYTSTITLFFKTVMNGKKGSSIQIDICLPPNATPQSENMKKSTKDHNGKATIPMRKLMMEVWEFAREDTDRMTFSLKVGLGCLLISLLILIQAPYQVFGTNFILEKEVKKGEGGGAARGGRRRGFTGFAVFAGFATASPLLPPSSPATTTAVGCRPFSPPHDSAARLLLLLTRVPWILHAIAAAAGSILSPSPPVVTAGDSCGYRLRATAIVVSTLCLHPHALWPAGFTTSAAAFVLFSSHISPLRPAALAASPPRPVATATLGRRPHPAAGSISSPSPPVVTAGDSCGYRLRATAIAVSTLCLHPHALWPAGFTTSGLPLSSSPHTYRHSVQRLSQPRRLIQWLLPPSDAALTVGQLMAFMILGEGSYGRVYLAELDNGKQLALKKLDSTSEQDTDTEFLTQVALVSRLKHENLLQMLGYCVEGNIRLLGFEFATMGLYMTFFMVIHHSLKHALSLVYLMVYYHAFYQQMSDLFQSIGRKGVQDAQPGPLLDWMQRVRIAVDAAKGLKYLHEKVKPSIIHRDIRSCNVVLFENYKAKVADFNLLNQAPDMAARLHSTRVLGTFGYHAPE
ncbi:hypothetical protein ZIOFF_068208 [Zingiber officinale]|uniref:Protein kinase domain-containing protein n=1 Tax=Zingiber officinale TaxID=94328 RepID=A0A8J5C7N8_ZINOF|nr:hypothetical protein ZIOFF_068208 [Zingiber officinale]